MVSDYKPMMSEERVRKLRAWHESASAGPPGPALLEIERLGRRFEVPSDVFEPKPVGLWQSVLDEVRDTDRVLDMGTGSGVNAILAAARASDIVAVDVNPAAVANAQHNARLNNVAERIDVRVSDLFEAVTGKFDLIMFDPPFRWFKPRSMRERSTADENYQTLTAFFHQVKNHLSAQGRILLFFGTSGDIDYLHHLIDKAGFHKVVVNHSDFIKDDMTVDYFTYRLEQRSA